MAKRVKVVVRRTSTVRFRTLDGGALLGAMISRLRPAAGEA